MLACFLQAREVVKRDSFRPVLEVNLDAAAAVAAVKTHENASINDTSVKLQAGGLPWPEVKWRGDCQALQS